MSTAVTALVVAGAFVALRVETRNRTRQVVAEQLTRSQRAVAGLQQKSLRNLLWTAALTTRNPTLRAAIETYRQERRDDSTVVAAQVIATVRREAQATLRELDQDLLILTDSDGRVLAASTADGSTPATPPDLSALAAVQAALDPTAFAGTASFAVIEVGGVAYRAGVVPIEMGGYPIGALIVGDRLSEFVEELEGVFGGGIVVVSGGRVVASALPGHWADEGLTAKLLADGGDLTATGLAWQGEEFKVASLRLGVDREGRPAVVYLLDSVNAALAQADRRLRASFIAYGLLAIGVVGVGTAGLGRALVRPLTRFIQFMGKVAASNDYASRFDEKPDGREIQSLTETYHHLVDSLARQHDALHRRSQDLAQANQALTHQIGERERAEHALADSEAQLRQAQKLEAIGTLAGGVAHDFNNLLTVISGHTSMLLEDLPPDSPVVPDLNQIQAAGDRAAKLTQQLLAFSRKQVTQPRVLDLNVVVRGVETLLRRLIGEDVRLKTVLTGHPVWIQADPTQLEQVLLNLAVNARDAMPSGGELGIELREIEESEVELRVTDTGNGMDAETLERVFEPFFTTKGVGKGTGLGLSTVYGIVRQAGGRISVDSKPGEGTTFRVVLPKTTQPAEISVTGEFEVAAPGGSETILIAEDEEPVRRFTAQVLTRGGYRVIEAGSGDEALKLAPAGTRIALLLTDVVMPGMSGKELHQRLSESRPGLKVLFMSGYPDDTIAIHGLLKPGLAFLQKPFRGPALLERVRDLLDGKLAVSGAIA